MSGRRTTVISICYVTWYDEDRPSPALAETGGKNGKTSAQAALRFLLQSGSGYIDTGKSPFFSHRDPEIVEWFMSIVWSPLKTGRSRYQPCPVLLFD